MAMPSRMLFCLTRRRTQSVTSTISLRCLVLTRSVIRAWDCMTIDLLEKAEANRPAKPHPIRADQLEVIPPGPLIDDAGAQVDRRGVAVVEHEPQFGQRARDFTRDAFCASRFDVTEIDDDPIPARFRKLHPDACQARGFSPRSFKTHRDNLPRIARQR